MQNEKDNDASKYTTERNVLLMTKEIKQLEEMRINLDSIIKKIPYEHSAFHKAGEAKDLLGSVILLLEGVERRKIS